MRNSNSVMAASVTAQAGSKQFYAVGSTKSLVIAQIYMYDEQQPPSASQETVEPLADDDDTGVVSQVDCDVCVLTIGI